MNNEIKIQVLGSGCPTCKKLYELTKEAVAEMNIDTDVEYITDIQKIVEMGVMSSPVLAVNGTPVMTGSAPDIEKIKERITAHLADLKSEVVQACCSDNNACDVACCKSDSDKRSGCSCRGDC